MHFLDSEERLMMAFEGNVEKASIYFFRNMFEHVRVTPYDVRISNAPDDIVQNLCSEIVPTFTHEFIGNTELTDDNLTRNIRERSRLHGAYDED
jgi:hypothetical protein